MNGPLQLIQNSVPSVTRLWSNPKKNARNHCPLFFQNEVKFYNKKTLYFYRSHSPPNKSSTQQLKFSNICLAKVGSFLIVIFQYIVSFFPQYRFKLLFFLRKLMQLLSHCSWEKRPKAHQIEIVHNAQCMSIPNLYFRDLFRKKNLHIYYGLQTSYGLAKSVGY